MERGRDSMINYLSMKNPGAEPRGHRVILKWRITLPALLTVLVFCTGCLPYYWLTWSSNRVLARNLMVTATWQELVFHDPPVPAKTEQAITLRKRAGDVADAAPGDWKVRLKDGTMVMPEIEIHDDRGNQFQLHVYAVDYFHIWFGPAGGSFPKDRVYTKIRIRSEIPFRCTIAWFCTKRI